MLDYPYYVHVQDIYHVPKNEIKFPIHKLICEIPKLKDPSKLALKKLPIHT